MGRRIDVGAVLPDHLVVGGAEAVLGDGVGLVRLRIGGRREFGLAEAGPDRRVGAKTVGEIDELFRRDGAVGAREIVGARAGGIAGNVHSTAITAAAARKGMVAASVFSRCWSVAETR